MCSKALGRDRSFNCRMTTSLGAHYSPINNVTGGGGRGGIGWAGNEFRAELFRVHYVGDPGVKPSEGSVGSRRS